MRRGLRALAWAGISALILLGGLYALGFGLVTLRAAGGAAPSRPVQLAALHALVATVAREAVLPQAALAFTAWLLLVRVAPRIDASWGALAASLPSCALLAFPVVGGLTFRAWSPGGIGDVVGTALLLSGSVGAALWLGRLAVPGLRPGSFGTTRR